MLEKIKCDWFNCLFHGNFYPIQDQSRSSVQSYQDLDPASLSEMNLKVISVYCDQAAQM